MRTSLRTYLRSRLVLSSLKVERLRFLIVGTGCSGTVYAAKLLSSAGIPCSHEAIFTPEGIEAARLRLHGRKRIVNSEISTRAGEWLKAGDFLLSGGPVFRG
jgi:hypothetical protein